MSSERTSSECGASEIDESSVSVWKVIVFVRDSEECPAALAALASLAAAAAATVAALESLLFALAKEEDAADFAPPPPPPRPLPPCRVAIMAAVVRLSAFMMDEEGKGWEDDSAPPLNARAGIPAAPAGVRPRKNRFRTASPSGLSERR